MKIKLNTINNKSVFNRADSPSFSSLTFNSGEDVFLPYEVEMVKNKGGNFRKRVDFFKNLYLSKYGYSRGLVTHIIKDNIKGQNLGYRACFIPNSGLIEILRRKQNNIDLIMMIGHEFRHFLQYANMFRHFGLQNAEELIRKTTVSALIDKLNNNEIEKKHSKTVEKIIDALVDGTPIINRAFWRKAVSQTPETDDFDQEFLDKTIEERIRGYSVQPNKKKEINSVYDYFSEKRDYIRNPYERDAYNYEAKLMHNFGLPYTNYLSIVADKLEMLEKNFDTINPNLSKEDRKNALIGIIGDAIDDLNMFYKELSPDDEISVLDKAISLVDSKDKIKAASNPSFKGKISIPITNETEILSPDEVLFIKNLDENFDVKVSEIKNFFLQKYGFEKDLAPHIIEPSLEDDDYIYSGRLNFNTGLLRISKKEEETSNFELAATIAHELRHFYQYAKLYKSVGIDRIYEINEDGNKAWIKQKFFDYFEIIKTHKMWKNPKNIFLVLKMLNEHRKKMSHIDVNFWSKVIGQTDDTPYDNAEFLTYFTNMNKMQRLIDEHSETYNYFKDNRDYMLDPFERDANNYEVLLKKQFGLDTSSISEHLQLALEYDKIEKILDTLPRTKEFSDNEEYFYMLINELFKKFKYDLKKDRFLETFEEKMSFLKNLFEVAKDFQSKHVN